MSSSTNNSNVWRSVVVTKNPVPAGTTFTVLLPWVEASTKATFLAKIFNRLEWGVILDINMIHKKATDGKKRAHYKVFIHFGDRNPVHAPVFEYLEVENNELKVWYNDRFFWKVRRSTWKPDRRNDIRVDFGTSPSVGVDSATATTSPAAGPPPGSPPAGPPPSGPPPASP